MAFRSNPGVVLVSNKPISREAKIAYAMRKCGMPSFLIYCQEGNYDPSFYFDYVMRASEPAEVSQLLRRLHPEIVHLFSSPFDEVAAQTLSLSFNQGGFKLIYDSFDYYENCLNARMPQEVYDGQRLCFSHADAIGCADLQAQIYGRANGLKRPKSLYFPDYCWNWALKENRRRANDDVHVVFAGSIQIEEWNSLSPDVGSYHLAKMLCEAGVYVHMYIYSASPIYDNKSLAKFIELESENPYLFLHNAVPMDQLPYELSKYDFGVHVRQGDVIDVEHRFSTQEHYESGMGSRLFDYVDAGLRLLLSPSAKLGHHHFGRFGIVEQWDSDFTRDPLTRLREAKKRIPAAAVAAAREKLSLDHNARRLVSFYKDLVPVARPAWEESPERR
jgi:hypothetical protein